MLCLEARCIISYLLTCRRISEEIIQEHVIELHAFGLKHSHHNSNFAHTLPSIIVTYDNDLLSAKFDTVGHLLTHRKDIEKEGFSLETFEEDRPRSTNLAAFT